MGIDMVMGIDMAMGIDMIIGIECVCVCVRVYVCACMRASKLCNAVPFWLNSAALIADDGSSVSDPLPTCVFVLLCEPCHVTPHRGVVR